MSALEGFEVLSAMTDADGKEARATREEAMVHWKVVKDHFLALMQAETF